MEGRTGDDASLVDRLRRGDPRAFEDLVIAYQHRVFGVALRLLGNRAEAEELAQEVFLRVHRAIGEFRGEAKLSTWLYAIASRLCLNRLASGERRVARHGDEALTRLASREVSPAEEAERSELETALHRAIAELGEERRIVVVLRDLEGLSYEEIAEALELELGTVRSRLHRARQEPTAPVVTQAPSVAPPEAPARENDAPRILYGARGDEKAREQDPPREAEKAKAAPRAQERVEGFAKTPEPGALADKKRAEAPARSAPEPAPTARDAELQKATESQDRQAPVVGKLEAPASRAERQRAAKDDVRPGTTQQTELRADSLKAQRPASAPPSATSAFVPPDVSGQLAVSDRELALRSLAELVSRLGAAQTRRFDTSDGPIIEIAVPREVYAELNRGLAQLGRWQPGKEPSTLPATVRVVVRITG